MGSWYKTGVALAILSEQDKTRALNRRVAELEALQGVQPQQQPAVDDFGKHLKDLVLGLAGIAGLLLLIAGMILL